MNLKGRNFLKLLDFTPEEITYLIDLSAELKEKKKKGIRHDVLAGKNIALIFEKTSTRTRCSFEVAAFDLGMHATFLDPSASQIVRNRNSGMQKAAHPFLVAQAQNFFCQCFIRIVRQILFS